jgi:threonine dehydrogenase-like Zn-dependent dehydrogenase
MLALTLTQDGPRLIRDQPEPTPPPGEVLIRPTRMGVCATDLELVKGYMGFAGVLGHEFVGIVESAADETGQRWIGKRVVGNINCVRSECDMVRAGLRDHARDRSVLGIFERDGCFAERFCLPVENLYEVPDHIDDDHAVFAEPLAAAFEILRQVTIEGRPYITVLGDGRLGLLVAQVLAQLNATVRVVGKHPRKLEFCDKWGIKNRLLDEIGKRQDQDIVVDCTGSPTGLITAMQLVRPRGTIVLKTTTTPPDEPLDLSPIVIHEINVVGSRCGPFPDALDALSAERIDVTSLISKRMKLSDGVNALRAAAQSDTIKVLLEP